MKTSLAICLTAILLVTTQSASAHHTSAMFDRDKQVKLVGTIVQFNWANPHSSIAIDVPNDSGGTDLWKVECGSPNEMVQKGWRSSSLKAGDKVTIMVHPLRNGDKGGSFMSVTLSDGSVLPNSSSRNSDTR